MPRRNRDGTNLPRVAVTDVLAANLSNLRVLRRLSQRELGRRAGVNYSLVCKVENLRVPLILLETLEKLAVPLWCRPQELLAERMRVPVVPSTWDGMAFRPDGRYDNQPMERYRNRF